MRILLIEDNPGDARLVQEILKEARGNFTISVAEKLDAGFKFLASQEDVDVVLMDLNLPDSRGLETLTKVQTGFSHLPIVIMTSLDDEELAHQAVRLGAQDYLVKGNVDSELLRRTILYSIKRKQAEEEIIKLNEELKGNIAELQAVNTGLRDSRRATLNIMEDALAARKRAEEAKEALRESQEQNDLLAGLIRDSSQPVAIGYPDGRLGLVNRAFEELTGYNADELRSIDWATALTPPEWRKMERDKLAELHRTGRPVRYEKEYTRKDGTRVPIELLVHLMIDSEGKSQYYYSFLTDITERRRTEEEREATVEFLRLVNDSRSTDDLVHAATMFFQERSGFEAVGIRLRKEHDYPYYEAHGFPKEFVRLESSLCARDKEGRPILDSVGDPVLECMCGNIIRGRYDPSKPFFTAKGSFWTNSTTELLASTTDADRQARTRNRCHGEGYESVGLFALSFGEERLGLIQLNDRRKGMFTPELIALWERLADYLAVAVTKFRTEEALKESERRYHSLFQNMTEGFAYCKMVYDSSGRPVDFIYIDVNRAFGKITGLVNVVGKKVTEVIPGIKESNPELFDIYSRVALTGQSERFEIEFKPLGMWLSISVYSTEIEHLVAVFDNITERKQTEEALQKSFSRFELLTATAGDLLRSTEPQKVVESICRKVMEYLDCHTFFNFLVDEQAGKLHLNACAGIPEEEVKKIEWLDFGVSVCGCAARDAQRMVAEHIPTTPDDRTELMKSFGIKAYCCHPLFGPRGKVIGTLSFGTGGRETFSDDDLSLMKAVADQVAVAMIRMRNEQDVLKLSEDMAARNVELETVNKELESFIYSISHDLRAPIRTMSGFAKIMVEEYTVRIDAQGKDYLSRILRGAEKMTRLIDDLLHLSKISRQAVERTEVDMSKIASSIVAELRESAPGRSVEVNIAEGLTALADPRLIKIVLSNLFGNAWKFTSKTENARIEFATLSRGEKSFAPTTVYYIKDNGAGFNPEYTEKMFLPFHRLHSDKEFEGTGIGLTIVERIIHRHGGRVWAEGEKGKGATLYFTLR